MKEKRKGKYKTTPEQIIHKVKELEKQGLTKTQISKETELCISVVARYTTPVRKHLKEVDKQMISKLYSEGLTQVEIGKIVGFSRDTVATVTMTLPKRKKPHNQVFKKKMPAPEKVEKVKKLKVKVTKQKPDSFGKDVNIRRLETKSRPPIYKSLKIADRTWIETFSEAEYQQKKKKYGL